MLTCLNVCIAYLLGITNLCHIDAMGPQTLKISMDAQRFEPLRRMAMYYSM